MKKLLLLLIFSFPALQAQQIDPDLQSIKQRMDSVQEFRAEIKLRVDISFINMPDKTAMVDYVRNQPLQVNSSDFVLIPKRGLDLSFSELFRYEFITVDRGTEQRDGNTYKVLNLIPADKRADYSIATVYLDTVRRHIAETEIQTRKDGAYTLKMNFSKDDDILPSNIEVNFEVEKVKIPIRYMTKEASIDKTAYKAEGLKTGIIYLNIDYKKIVLN